LAGQQVLIVDDSPDVRQELRTLLPLAGSIEVVGEAADGWEAIRRVAELQQDAAGVCVILLDLQMPGMDGYQAAREIKRRWPRCRLVALTVHDDAAARLRASEAGVDEFLVKGAPLQALVDAISAVSTDPGAAG
jgi:DNA-binding NarL/FixJ family response regulator